MQGFFDTLRIELREVEWMCLCHRGLLQQISDKGFRADGQPLGQSPRDEKQRQYDGGGILCIKSSAMERRKREHIMTLKGKVTPWAKLILPELVDRIAAYAARATTSAGERLLAVQPQFRRNRAPRVVLQKLERQMIRWELVSVHSSPCPNRIRSSGDITSRNYLAMRTLVFSLAVVIPTSGRNGERTRMGYSSLNDFSVGAAIWSGIGEALPTVSATN